MKKNGGKDCFQLLEQFVVTNEAVVSCNIKSVSKEPLPKLINLFEKYFQEDNTDKLSWIQGKFRAKASSSFTSVEERNLTELFYDSTPKITFSSIELIGFLVSVKQEYLLSCCEIE